MEDTKKLELCESFKLLGLSENEAKIASGLDDRHTVCGVKLSDLLLKETR
jgi:hypothetical protein